MIEAALKAAIAGAPRDPEPYMVYADWLQGRGDVRGTWIALHDAQRRGSNTDTAMTELLEQHGGAIMGALHMRNDVKYDWFQGFIQTIHVRGDTFRQIGATLRQLVDNPVASFIETIVIPHPEEPERIESLLATLRQPPLLTYLVIGKPGVRRPTAELVAAFPRLGGTWADVLEAVAGLSIKPQVDTTTLPALELHPGVTALAPDDLVRGLRAEVELRKPIGLVQQLPRVATRDSLDRFALALGRTGHAWAFELVGSLGGDACAVALGKRVEEQNANDADDDDDDDDDVDDEYEDDVADQASAHALKAVAFLRRVGSDVAITELVRLAMVVEQPYKRRVAIREALELAALERNSDSLTQLIARTCPRVVTGQREATLAELQRKWFLEMMIAGDRLGRGDFEQHVLGHPWRRPLSGRVVWAEVLGPELRPFLVDGDGVPCDAEGAPRELVAKTIGIPHPLELAADVRDRWQAALVARGIEPLFEQLARPTFELTPSERKSDQVARFAKRRPLQRDAETRFVERGWYRWEDGRLGREKPFRRGNTYAQISVRHGHARLFHGDRRKGAPLVLGTQDAITLSELLYDLVYAYTLAPGARAQAKSRDD